MKIKKPKKVRLRNSRSTLLTLVGSLVFIASFGAVGLYKTVGHYLHAQQGSASVEVRVVGYNGTVLATSRQHDFGNCNTSPAPGQFTNFSTPTTCTGIRFGPPDGVYLVLAAVPQGYYFNGWVLLSAQTDGQANCSAVYNCFFNFTNGSVVVEAVFSQPPPSAPQLSVGATTTTSASINWTASQGYGGFTIASYHIFHNQNFLTSVSPSTLSYTLAGLTCGQAQSFQVEAIDTNNQATFSNLVNTTTAACPASGGGGSTSPGGSSGGGGSAPPGGSTSPPSGGTHTSTGGSSSGSPSSVPIATAPAPSSNGLALQNVTVAPNSGSTTDPNATGANSQISDTTSTGTEAPTITTTNVKKGSSVWMIFFIVLLVPLLAVGGYLFYLYWRRRQADHSKYSSYIHQERGY